MVKVKHLLIGLACVLVLVGLVFWLTLDFWRDQFHAYARGTVEVAAEKYGWLLPEIDQVEFSLIGSAEASETNGFPHRVGQLEYHAIVAQKTIIGEEAKEFRKKWRAMAFSRALSGMCHEPAYGLRFFKDRKLLFETTLCWKCSNFSVPTPLGYTYCGFEDKNQQAQAVWELLQKHMPLLGETEPTKK